MWRFGRSLAFIALVHGNPLKSLALVRPEELDVQSCIAEVVAVGHQALDNLLGVDGPDTKGDC